jgi:heme A synthase
MSHRTSKIIGVMLGMAAVVVFIAPHRVRPAALGATAFAILGTAFGMTVTIPRGRAADIVYHSALLAWLLATGALLLRRDRPAATQRPSDQEHQAVTPTRR